jgi:hypothetical protein
VSVPENINFSTFDEGVEPRPRTPAEREMEAVRIERLREDARRPLSVNLEETIALSHFLLSFAGAARPRR